MSMNPVSSLSTFIQAVGQAYVYITSTPTVAGSWALLGVTEGDIGLDEKYKFNDYVVPEWTGDTIHKRNVDGQTIQVTVPLIWGDSALYDSVSPTGSKGGGRSAPVPVSTKTVAIVPLTEVSTGLSYNGTSWAPAAPVHALWIPRATFEPGNYAFKHADGGKVIRTITIHGMFDDTQPENHKVYTIGDFAAQGITTWRV